MFAENFGALYEEVDAREPDSAKHVGLHTSVASPQIRRHSTSCASPIHPPGNPFPGKRGGNSLSLGAYYSVHTSTCAFYVL